MNNYQVVRQGFFESSEDPQLVVSNGRIYVNSFALTLFPDENYTIFMIDDEQKTVILKPFEVKVKDSFRWCTSGKKRKPRRISSSVLTYKLCNLMDWDFYSRYRICGIKQASPRENVLFFDLKEAVCYKVMDEYDENGNLIVKKQLPKSWENSFGIARSEYNSSEVISTYDEDKVFAVELKSKKYEITLKKPEETNGGNN